MYIHTYIHIVRMPCACRIFFHYLSPSLSPASCLGSFHLYTLDHGSSHPASSIFLPSKYRLQSERTIELR